MSKQEIIEGNKLIAEFMGWSTHPKLKSCSINKNRDRVLPFWVGYNMEIPNDEFKYHSSWDWLMPVVEKIENTKPFYSVSNNAGFWYNDETDTVDRNKLQYLCIISDKSYRIIINSANYFPERNNKLVATWLTVVEFIKWYNSCQK